VNTGDLARSILLTLSEAQIQAYPDPGGPLRDDRETVILKSGSAKGRPWRRKPRLQVRMAPGYEIPFMRRALGLALALETGGARLEVAGAHVPKAPLDPPPEPEKPQENEELVRLRTIISVLSFDPLEGGVHDRDDALYVFGLPAGRVPDAQTLRARFRMLATIHHPDSETGDHRRMSQLNTAMAILKR